MQSIQYVVEAILVQPCSKFTSRHFPPALRPDRGNRYLLPANVLAVRLSVLNNNTFILKPPFTALMYILPPPLSTY